MLRSWDKFVLNNQVYYEPGANFKIDKTIFQVKVESVLHIICQRSSILAKDEKQSSDIPLEKLQVAESYLYCS